MFFRLTVRDKKPGISWVFLVYIWMFPKIGVPPKSSILIIGHYITIHFGVPLFLKTPIYTVDDISQRDGCSHNSERAETKRPPDVVLNYWTFWPPKNVPQTLFTSFHISWLVYLHIICISIRIDNIYIYMSR